MSSASGLPKLPQAAIEALEQGLKIQAIKLVRAETNLGLKEAKDLVERYLADNPEVQAKYAANKRNAGCGVGLLAWALVSIVLLKAVL